ncbi:MAG: methyl-coenzyme M reductase operon protein D [Candidatus Verstraetearchaeota archaeon]|nr:methyl-coenzyme M reductase operon protein D [Candidatus Verstraetearchaeota archaeon]
MSQSPHPREIEVMPRRLMSSKKATDLSAIMRETDGVEEVLTHTIKYSGGGAVTGRFILVLKEGFKPEDVIEKIRPVCEQSMPYGYDIRVGQFTKPRPTVKDYLRGLKR